MQKLFKWKLALLAYEWKLQQQFIWKKKQQQQQQNEWFVPQIVTKIIEAGQDEYRNTLEKLRKLTITYKYRHAKTLRSNRFKAVYTMFTK